MHPPLFQCCVSNCIKVNYPISRLYGYTTDENGDLVIHMEQAKIVEDIYCITSSRMHDELIQKVGAVIGEISQIDESVNSNILVESLY